MGSEAAPEEEMNMKCDKLSILFFTAMLLLALACGKDREDAPSNREGYTDSSIPAPGTPPRVAGCATVW